MTTTDWDGDAGDGCIDCGCALADHNNDESGGGCSCGDCEGYL